MGSSAYEPIPIRNDLDPDMGSSAYEFHVFNRVYLITPIHG